MPRVQKAWKEQYYGNLFAGYDLVQDKEALERAIHVVDESGIFSKENS